jgi:hypothetical protein
MLSVRGLLPLLFVVLPSFAAHAAPGDVNGDGSITVADAVLAARFASHVESPTAAQLAAADVASANGAVRDWEVDWHDVTNIACVAGGLLDFTGANAPAGYLPPLSETLKITGDLTRDYQFRVLRVDPPPPPGIPVSGQVSGITEGMRDPLVWFIQYRQGGYSGYGTGIRPDGGFTKDLAAGDYSLYYGATATEAADGGTYAWQFSAPMNRTVTIDAPMTLELTAPGSPPTGTLGGSLDLGSLVPTSVTASGRIVHTGAEFALASPLATGIVAPDSYSVKAIPAPYVLSFIASDPAAPETRFNLNVPGGDITAGEAQTRDVSLPAAVPVTFNITPPPGGSVAQIRLVGYRDDNTVQLSSTVSVPDGATSYASVAPPGDYSASVDVALASPPEDRVSLIVSYVPVTVPEGGGAVSVPIPIPTMVTFRGHVMYPNGSPVPGATVRLGAYFDSTANLPYAASASTVTDAAGAFSIVVPVATYGLTVYAPVGS